jgi:hypothetical protein
MLTARIEIAAYDAEQAAPDARLEKLETKPDGASQISRGTGNFAASLIGKMTEYTKAKELDKQ